MIRSPVSFRLMPSALQLLNGSFAAFCSAPKPHGGLGTPFHSICSGEMNSPGIKVLPPAKRLAPQSGGSLTLAKEAEHSGNH